MTFLGPQSLISVQQVVVAVIPHLHKSGVSHFPFASTVVVWLVKRSDYMVVWTFWAGANKWEYKYANMHVHEAYQLKEAYGPF